MADSDPEPEIASLRHHLSSSIFSIPGYLAGFGAKSLPDFDSIRSPTSPLDLGVFSSFRKPRFARSSSERTCRKKDSSCDGVVGLGIIVNSAPDPGPGPLRPNKNIIFGPQVRPNTAYFLGSFHRYGSIDSSLRSKSLPTNYVESRLSRTERIDEKEVPSENTSLLCFSDPKVPSSMASLGYNICPLEAKPVEKSPLAIGSGVVTVPIPIVGSLSAREIELSEDYTCIISHGPDPKTIHIFGDCVLECLATESNCFRNNIDQSRAAENPERSSDLVQVLTFCFGCNKKFEEGEEIYMYRGDKAFCGFDCCSGYISEDETEEDLFSLGMPIAM